MSFSEIPFSVVYALKHATHVGSFNYRSDTCYAKSTSIKFSDYRGSERSERYKKTKDSGAFNTATTQHTAPYKEQEKTAFHNGGGGEYETS